jgi:iron-sulfur cluster repair protein YtfE (RIC family)
MLTAQTIQSAFAVDHDRLDALFADFARLRRSDFARAREVFMEFKFGLQRHIVWEENVLFPLFEQKTGIHRGGPTEVMRIEHRRIGGCLEAIHRKVKAHDPDCGEEEALLEVLTAHNEKEEAILYPALDHLLSDAEKAAAFEVMEKVPEESYRTCCGHHS